MKNKSMNKKKKSVIFNNATITGPMSITGESIYFELKTGATAVINGVLSSN